MASLEEQGKQRARQLSRHLSDAAPELAGRLRQQRSDAMRCSEQGVTFFSPPDASSSADPGESSCDCGLVLPSFAGYPPAVREAVVGQLCNAYLQKEAEQVGGREAAAERHACWEAQQGGWEGERGKGCLPSLACAATLCVLLPTTSLLLPNHLFLDNRKGSSTACPAARSSWCSPLWGTETACPTPARWACGECTTGMAGSGKDLRCCRRAASLVGSATAATRAA